MVEAVLRAAGPYSLRLTAGTATWTARLPERALGMGPQLSDGSVAVRASCERAIDEARFMLALDHDTSEFHRVYAATRSSGRPCNSCAGCAHGARQRSRMR